jgi:L-lactate dehydrogenase complex protein LldG
MTYDPAEARRAILDRLRGALSGPRPVFRDRSHLSGAPGTPSAVTGADGDRRSLAEQFGVQLEEIYGTYEILEDATEARARLVQLVTDWSTEEDAEVLSWASRALPIENLGESLEESGISLFVPEDLHDESTRARAARARIGLTGADAAFASTGSIVVASGRGKSRAASLLPLRHLVLVPMSRIYPTFEAWLHTLRQEQGLGSYLRVSGQIVFITGPSKSADIELNLTLGVHGPRVVHALIYDDAW